MEIRCLNAASRSLGSSDEQRAQRPTGIGQTQLTLRPFDPSTSSGTTSSGTIIHLVGELVEPWWLSYYNWWLSLSDSYRTKPAAGF